jgi:hypothetical protein
MFYKIDTCNAGLDCITHHYSIIMMLKSPHNGPLFALSSCILLVNIIMNILQHSISTETWLVIKKIR